MELVKAAQTDNLCMSSSGPTAWRHGEQWPAASPILDRSAERDPQVTAYFGAGAVRSLLKPTAMWGIAPERARQMPRGCAWSDFCSLAAPITR